jgi:hypothetical protein
MRSLISAILMFLLLASAFAPLLGVKSVAAQGIQQSQSSGTTPSKPEKETQSSDTAKIEKASSLQIPDGTPVEIEAPYTLRSMDFKPNDKISFRVVNPIKVNGITLIEQGATATGRIEKSKRGGHWGKAGLLVWTMQTVTAVDGSQIFLRVASVRLRGDSKGAKVATQMIITGALMPLIAPVALLHGFKRGKDAYIPAGKRYSVFVEGTSSVIAGSNLVDGSVPPVPH